MKVSLVLTVHSRPPDVSKQVADSFLLKGNRADEVVIVLDRPTEESRQGVVGAWSNTPFRVRFIEIEGKPEWVCPARAWNRGYEAATGDLLYCISSEVVQDPGNVDKARELCEDSKTVVFGACHNSTNETLVIGAEPGELVSSKMPRPLGFIVCMPRKNIMAIGGNDLGFMDGLWYEDEDLFLRLWRTGVDFVFDDGIHGTHLHHPRPILATPEGQAKIVKNAAYMTRKHGTLQPWAQTMRLVQSSPGRTIWRHL